MPQLHAYWILQMPASKPAVSLICGAELIESTLLAVIRETPKGESITLKYLERKLRSQCNEHPVDPYAVGGHSGWILDSTVLQG